MKDTGNLQVPFLYTFRDSIDIIKEMRPPKSTLNFPASKLTNQTTVISKDENTSKASYLNNTQKILPEEKVNSLTRQKGTDMRNQPADLDKLDCIKHKDHFIDKLNEDSSEEEECLSENKELIDTLTLKTNLNSKVLVAAKSAYFNNKIKEFNYEKNKGSHSATEKNASTIYLSPTKSSFHSPKLDVNSNIIHKTLGPKNYYSSVNQQSPSLKKSLNGIDEVPNAMLSDNDDKEDNQEVENKIHKENQDDDPYDALERTQEIIVSGDINRESIKTIQRIKSLYHNSGRNNTELSPFKNHFEDDDQEEKNNEASGTHTTGKRSLSELENNKETDNLKVELIGREAHTISEMVLVRLAFV